MKNVSIKIKIFLFSTMLILLFILSQYIPNIGTFERFEEKSQTNLQKNNDLVYLLVENQINSNLSKDEIKQNLKKSFSSITIGREGFPFIVDSKGNFIIHKEVEGQNWSDKPFIEFMLKNRDGFHSYVSPKTGKVKFVAFKYLKEKDWIVASGMWADEYKEITDYNNKIMYISITFSIIVVILFVGYFIRLIVKPILEFNRSAEMISGGNYDINLQVKSNDEVGHLANGLNTMAQNIKENIAQVDKKSVEAEIARAEADKLATESKNNADYLRNSIHNILQCMTLFSKGDLTIKIDIDNKDVIGELANGINETVKNIHRAILGVNDAVQATASSSAEISSSTEEMAAGASMQVEQTRGVVASINEITSSIEETANNANVASNLAQESSSQAKIGVQKVQKSQDGMKKIVESTQSTGAIISSLTNKTNQIDIIAQVIDEIADQTNLLALNAAIEAARAGEQGRGFAVVADEVRKLAERTTKATKEIAETIKSIQIEAKEANGSMANASQVVEDGLKLTNEVESVLNNILKSSEKVFVEISKVANASKQQTILASEVSSNVENIKNVTNETTVVISQVAEAAEDLNRLTENLSMLVGNFKFNNSASSSAVCNFR
ncbi:MAG: Cache 3/Cache 2 fusion domain-containing protein [Bacteroidetes bacterium]|nr:Cache 3/Cache 2 fusion domain-containing protein [Bacteroidota bacterium]MBU1116780.1 Cache 3/Cache 2 fusion domain-containing protein [Bacteroidota bacterium]MBU1798381.1 Cache 3/Cache 2 fusion domain-containing protein [Bacteroidota bacterium]